MKNKNHLVVKYILRRMTFITRKIESGKWDMDIICNLDFCHRLLYYLDVCVYWDDIVRKWKEV